MSNGHLEKLFVLVTKNVLLLCTYMPQLPIPSSWMPIKLCCFCLKGKERREEGKGEGEGIVSPTEFSGGGAVV